MGVTNGRGSLSVWPMAGQDEERQVGQGTESRTVDQAGNTGQGLGSRAADQSGDRDQSGTQGGCGANLCHICHKS